ncbi:MAG: U32 family peptidase [Alphaproteobacteria bacterium]
MAKLALGPVLFNWLAEEKRDFYFRIADEAPVDIVYLGEVVCSKRAAFFDPYLGEVTARLERAGKEVVHSTLALIMSEREMDAVRAVAADGVFVEANDMSCAALLAGTPHVIGPFINVYNEGTLKYLVRRGATRFVVPGELSARSLAVLAKAADGAEIEVQVFGRLPLAISARCYHARAHGLHKDGCQYVCAEDRDGLGLETLDGEPFLAVNGTQTMSHGFCSLIGELGEMRKMGIGCVRLWPHSVDMVEVAGLFRAVLDGREGAAAAEARLEGLVHMAPLSNGFYHGREGAVRVTTAQPSPAG